MADQTEAACLLESGAMYRRRLLLRREGADPVFAGFKPGAFSVYFGDAPIVHFDLDGRWQRVFLDGIHYLKGLDTNVQAIDRVREGKNLVLVRRTLAYDERSDLDGHVRELALGVLGRLDSESFDHLPPPSQAEPVATEELRDTLERIADWDAAAWFAHRERYLAAYGPLPILPPDCPNPVILETARDGRLRSADDFATHASDVARLLGRRIEQSKVVFLTGSDWLRGSADEAVAYLETVRKTFRPDDSRMADGSHRLEAVHAYLDAPFARRQDWRRLREKGLVRLSLGFAPEDSLIEVVNDLKAAGVGVGVIVPGGGRIDPAETASLVNRLELGPGDLVSLLDADDLGGLVDAPDPQWGAASPTRQARLDDLKARLSPVRTARKAKVAPFLPGKQGL